MSRIPTAIFHLVSIFQELLPLDFSSQVDRVGRCARMLTETCLKRVWSIVFEILRHIVRDFAPKLYNCVLAVTHRALA